MSKLLLNLLTEIIQKRKKLRKILIIVFFAKIKNSYKLQV